MLQHLARYIMKSMKWSVKIKVDIPLPDKCIICVAPHTSNWDFIICQLAILSEKIKSGFLMKETWFFWPLGNLFRAIGGIPVPRRKGSHLTDAIVEAAKTNKNFVLAVTPEGTRSYTENWRKGFLHIAYNAQLPIFLAYLDYNKKEIVLDKQFHYVGDVQQDLTEVKKYYKDIPAKYPEKFGTGL